MSEPVLRVVTGSPTAEELAVVAAVMSAAGGAESDLPAPRERCGGWNDPAARLRTPLLPGPNGWRAAAGRY